MPPFFLGIDMGSSFSKAILAEGKRVAASYACPSGGDFRVTAEKLLQEIVSRAGLRPQDIVYAVATGYGSRMADFADATVTDISAHAKGVIHLCPSVRTVVDVGDLYSKVFRMDEKGDLRNFLLSGKCAGGSARALTVIAKVLQLKVEDMGELALKSPRKWNSIPGVRSLPSPKPYPESQRAWQRKTSWPGCTALWRRSLMLLQKGSALNGIMPWWEAGPETRVWSRLWKT
jgi:predicted CoA-substrate-specific enzyme activase